MVSILQMTGAEHQIAGLDLLVRYSFYPHLISCLAVFSTRLHRTRRATAGSSQWSVENSGSSDH